MMKNGFVKDLCKSNDIVSAEMDALRQRSGEECSDNPLVSFLYELMRDHVPPGTIERIVLNSPAGQTKFTNGYLAQYAKDVAHRLERKNERAAEGAAYGDLVHDAVLNNIRWGESTAS
jgi:hypothetical protein